MSLIKATSKITVSVIFAAIIAAAAVTFICPMQLSSGASVPCHGETAMHSAVISPVCADMRGKPMNDLIGIMSSDPSLALLAVFFSALFAFFFRPQPFESRSISHRIKKRFRRDLDSIKTHFEARILRHINLVSREQVVSLA